MRDKTSWLRAMAFAFVAASGAAAEERLELRLVVIDLVGVPPLVKEGLLQEARRLLVPAGITLRARPAPATDERDLEELAVILLPERSRAPARGSWRLGAVQTVAAATTIWIDVKAVAAVADAAGGLSCCSPQMRPLSLALGRVLTHELVHVLLPSLAHARSGLMARRVGRATLVDDPTPTLPPLLAKRPIHSSSY